VRLRRGIKAWSEYLARHLRVGGRAAREEDETDSSAPLGREKRGEAASSKGANQKGKRIPVKTRPTRELGGPVGVVSACGGSEASGLAGPKAEWAARSTGLKVRKKNF
jgi:hypothetical protein